MAGRGPVPGDLGGRAAALTGELLAAELRRPGHPDRGCWAVLARGYMPEMVQELYGWVKKVLWEAGREDMPVLANVDFGHTSPQLTLRQWAGTMTDMESAGPRCRAGAVRSTPCP